MVVQGHGWDQDTMVGLMVKAPAAFLEGVIVHVRLLLRVILTE
jgi:hypothetical protein